MRRAGEVVSKPEILDNVWDFAFDGDPNIVEVYIRHLRRKLDEPFGRQLIETIRGAGYRLDPERRVTGAMRRRDRSGCASRSRRLSSSASRWRSVAFCARARAPRLARRTTSRPPPGCARGHRGDDQGSETEPARSRCHAATSTSCRWSTAKATSSTSSANIPGDVAHQHACARRRRVRGPHRHRARRRGDAHVPHRGAARRDRRRRVHRLRGRGASTLSPTAPTASCGSCSSALPLLLAARGRHHLGGDRAGAAPGRVDPRRGRVIGGAGPPPARARARDDDEIGRLARTMNAMLARLEDATERQRRFVADASHELRSPLTGIRAQLEVDLVAPRARRLAGDRARACSTTRSACSGWSTICSCSRWPTVRADRRDAPGAGRPRRDRARREPAGSRGDTAHRRRHAGGVGRAGRRQRRPPRACVRNLLDNAERHAALGTVAVSLEESSTEVTLRVADDGPGIPDADRERIFERFAKPRRRPRPRRSAAPGSASPSSTTS